MENTFRIFTDGSVIGNPGCGGWAAVLMSGEKIWEISGSSPWTTISEMELQAAVEALRLVPAGSHVELCSDSELLIHGMRFRVFRWQRQGWRNGRGLDLQHQELWSELIQLNGRMNIQWHWIRGHSGHRRQSRADELAHQAARSLWVQQKLAA
jgi:ribonuclease HI